MMLRSRASGMRDCCARVPSMHIARELYEFPAVTKVAEAELTSRSPAALARRGLLEPHRAD
eukprot:5345367-Pyramimonas_sp.AAC.1